MEEPEDWKLRFVSLCHEVEDSFRELDGVVLLMDTLYTMLDKCNQLIRKAVQTACTNRLNIHVIELIYMDPVSGRSSLMSLEKFLLFLCCSMQKNSKGSKFSVEHFLSNTNSIRDCQNITPLESENIESINRSAGNGGETCRKMEAGMEEKGEEEEEQVELSCSEFMQTEGAMHVHHDSLQNLSPDPDKLNVVLVQPDGSGDRSSSEEEVDIEPKETLRKINQALKNGKRRMLPSSTEGGSGRRADVFRKKNVPSDSPPLKKRRTYLGRSVIRGSTNEPKTVVDVQTRREGTKKISHSINFLAYKCFLCKPSICIYGSFKDLTTHISSEHAVPDGSDSRVLYCSLRTEENNCSWSKRFVNVMDREQVAYSLSHLILYHDEAIPDFVEPFRCPHPNCDFQAIRKFNVNSHLVKHKSDLVPCKECGKMLKKRSMKLHHLFCEVTGSKDRPNVCPVEHCGKSFKSKYSLPHHIRTCHENVKAYTCAYCNKGFANKSDITLHVYARHGINMSGHDAYACPICNFTTVNKRVLRRHMAKVHAKIWRAVSKGRSGLELEQKEAESMAAGAVQVKLEELGLEAAVDPTERQKNGMEQERFEDVANDCCRNGNAENNQNALLGKKKKVPTATLR